MTSLRIALVAGLLSGVVGFWDIPLGQGEYKGEPAKLWLNYQRKVSAKFAIDVPELVCHNATASEPLGRACQELSNGLTGMMKKAPEVVSKASKEGALVIMMESDVMSSAPWPPQPKSEGYTIRKSNCAGDKTCLAIIGKSGPGALYGAFALLQ